MSASAHCAGAADPEALVLVFTVENAEGRSSLAEVMATLFDGLVLPTGRAAKQASKRKPCRKLPRVPFVQYAPRAGRREFDCAVRALRRGWWPMVTCREFRLSAGHPEAWRVAVMPVHEPVYKPDVFGFEANPERIPERRAELEAWALEGLVRQGNEPLTMPASMLRATAEAVQ